MPRLKYAPKALEDLQVIKRYVTNQFGEERAIACVRAILSTIKQLEMFPDEGLDLRNMIKYQTVYHCLVVKPNYVFYRMENEIVKIIRILNEKQDFMQILFGISSISEEGEQYWDGEEDF